MKHFEYFNEENNLIVTGLRDFNIKEILECGQCFRFERLDELALDYRITALGRDLIIHQPTEDRIVLENCDKTEFEGKWIHYFDLETDYSEIKRKISEDDEIMRSAVEYAGGIRLLNQEPYECLLSFIISQNNNIPRIKGIIAAMSDKYGRNGSFPTLNELENVSDEELFALRMGFRSKYIYDAVHRLKDGEVILDNLFALDSDSARTELMKIKGVGPKVADCTLLFSLGHRDVFPIDVWVRRVISELYFGGEEQSIKTVGEFAKNKWGELAGFAQQYLFYFARSGEMKKNTIKLLF